MIDKKILLGGAGVAAVSIAVAITVNVVINAPADQSVRNTQLSCVELQQKINNLDHSGFNQLPEKIKKNIRDIRQDHTCNLTGKDWSLNLGKIRIHTKAQTNMHDGQNILDDFK